MLYIIFEKIDENINTIKKREVYMIHKNGFLFLVIACAASSLFAANLFSTNSGFETALTPWKLSYYDTTIANAKISQDTAGVKFGKKYCKVNVTKVDADSTGHNWYVQLWEPTWPTKKNLQYTYSFWGKSGDTISRMIHVAATGAGDTDEYAYRTGKSFTLTKEWQKCEFPYTWTDASTKMHFRMFLAGTKGAVCFDSMALDTATATPIKAPFALADRRENFSYGVQLLPNSMRIVSGNSSSDIRAVSIYSLGGQLLASRNIQAASGVEIPKPASGAWILDVNSNKKVIQVP